MISKPFRFLAANLTFLIVLTTQPAWAVPSIATKTGALTLPEKFTGKRLDAEIGLYDYGARSYDPAFARFLTPDTAGPSYSDPQTLNPYAYTRNNPVKLKDPTGEGFWLYLLDIVGTASDIYFTATDVVRYFQEPTVENLKAVGSDIGFALIPFVSIGAVKLGAQTGELVSSAASKIRQAARQGELTGEVGRGLSTAQREAMAGGRQFQKGALAAEGLGENSQLITSTIQTRTGPRVVTTRPDSLTATTLGEIKDVKRLSRTKQLAGEIQAAKDSGRKFVLTVSQKLQHITGPLKKELENVNNALRQFDERTREFRQLDINRF